MPRIITSIGIVLVVLGVGGYFGTGAKSVTALIPAFLGVPILLLGILSMRAAETGRRRLVLGASILAVLGFLGSARGIPQLAAMLGGATVERPTAVILQSATAALCLLLAILSLVSTLLRSRSTRGSAAPSAGESGNRSSKGSAGA